MSSFNNIIEYDKEGRMVFMKLIEPEIIYKYKYEDDERVCTIESPKNKSNYKTTTFQTKTKDGYIDRKVIQNGEVYDIEIEYDKEGRELEIFRTNKKKNTLYKKRIIRDKNGEALIWFEKYNENFSIGFKVDMELLK
jgi:hypothetical protein